MVTLTKAEERIMQILWDIEKGFVKDIREEFPDPKPPYNTVSTIVRVLVKKEVVAFNQYGKTYEYYPLVSKDEYKNGQLNSLVNKYFNSSFKQLVSFFSEKKDLSVQEVDEVLQMLQDLKDQKESAS